MAFYNNVLIGLGVETQCIASLLFGMCIIWQKKSPIGGGKYNVAKCKFFCLVSYQHQ